MSALTDRIAEVLRRELSLADYDGDHLYEGLIDPRELAERIEAELDLTEEWSNRGAPGIWLSREGAERYARYHGETLKHRWVSARSEVAR